MADYSGPSLLHYIDYKKEKEKY